MKEANEAAPSKRVKQTRKKILQAASAEFSLHGYGGATTRMIAARAGVNELTIFRHFASKKNLFLQVITHYSAIPEMKKSLQQQLSGDVREDLLLIAGQFLSLVQSRRNQIIMSLYEGRNEPEVHQVVASIQQHQKRILAEYIGKQVRRGRLRACDENLAAGALLGMFFSHAIEQVLHDDASSLSNDTVTDAYVDYFLNGLLVERKGVE